MSYDINKVFGTRPAIAHSLEQAVEYEEIMIVLEIDEEVEIPEAVDIKFFELVNRFLDTLEQNEISRPLLLECDFNSIPNRDIIHRALQDGSIYSSYYKQIDSRTPLKSFVAKNIDELSRNGSILCFPNALIGFTINYLFLIIFDGNLLNRTKETALEFNYVNVGRNNFGIKTLGINKFDIPFLNLCTPAPDKELSYVRCLDSTTKKIVELFSTVNYVLCSYNNRLLDKGYFIRINLDGDAHERALLEVLESLDPTCQNMKMIYHGVVADSLEDNRLLLSGKLHQEDDINLQLQSFLSEEISIVDFMRGKFNRIMEDNSIFFNENMIFTYYDLGADLRFFNKKDYEKLFKIYNKSHTIQMASYIPEGEHVAHLYPHKP